MTHVRNTCTCVTVHSETPRPAAARRPRAPIIPWRSPYMAANRCVDGSPTALRAPAAPATVFSRSYSGGTTVGCVEVSCASPAPQEGASFLHSTRTRLYEYARAMRSSCRHLMCKLTPSGGRGCRSSDAGQGLPFMVITGPSHSSAVPFGSARACASATPQHQSARIWGRALRRTMGYIRPSRPY